MVLNTIKNGFYFLMDIALSPLTAFFAFYFKKMRERHFQCLPFSKKILQSVGVFPITDHYYEPLIDRKLLKEISMRERNLPGIDFNVKEQLSLLARFNYNDELASFPIEAENNNLQFSYNNGPFKSGDSELLYSFIRYFKPRRLIEVGSGYSTLMSTNATRQNKLDDASYCCEHTCIEPYENDWLEQTSVKIIRELVENTDLNLYSTLEKNDILFIDSTHIIKPHGDVLFEYLEILPILKPGVIVHIHDIFTPNNYPSEWLEEEVRFWNEQYLLEAFLYGNKNFKVLCAVNYLRHNHFKELSAKCPVLKLQVESGIKREPGSFWMVRN